MYPRSVFNHISPILAKIFDIQRIVIFKKNVNSSVLDGSLEFFEEWCDTDIPSRYDNHQELKTLNLQDIYKDFEQTLARRKLFIIDKKNKVMRSDGVKQFYHESDIKSFMVIPIFSNDDFWGTVALHDIKKERDFEESGLSLSATMIGYHLSSYIQNFEMKQVLSKVKENDHAQKMFSLGKLASSIAHEINNPIFIIGGFASRLENLVQDNKLKLDDVKMCSMQIQQNCQKVTNIIEGLRLMSRRADREELEVIDVNIIVKRLLDISKEGLQFEGIKLETDFFADELLVECKPGELSQVVSNLINNASDSLCDLDLEEKVISVKTYSHNNKSIIEFLDNGPRPNDEVLDSMMEPFFSTKSSSKGTGLGLSICKEIIDRYDGNIFIDRNVQNVKFVIELPLVEFSDF